MAKSSSRKLFSGRFAGDLLSVGVEIVFEKSQNLAGAKAFS